MATSTSVSAGSSVAILASLSAGTSVAQVASLSGRPVPSSGVAGQLTNDAGTSTLTDDTGTNILTGA